MVSQTSSKTISLPWRVEVETNEASSKAACERSTKEREENVPRSTAISKPATHRFFVLVLTGTLKIRNYCLAGFRKLYRSNTRSGTAVPLRIAGKKCSWRTV